MFLSHLFKLPTPLELGHSSHDSSPTRSSIGSSIDSHSWEEWRKEVKKLHPIKYFISETLFNFINRNIMSKFKKFHYWIVSHLIPSRRYHMLDLRQPHNSVTDNYRYGWKDTDNRMLFAMFNLLNDFVKYELPTLHFPSKKETVQNEGARVQREAILEIRRLHAWWNIERKIKARQIDNRLNAWASAKKENIGNHAELFNKLRTLEEEFDLKEEEMTIRLMKVRKNLWS